MGRHIKLAVFAAVVLLLNETSGTAQLITGFIQRNALGIPMLHEEQKWPFDPDAGLRNSVEYQRENGVRGERFIERIGLGTDGNQERRLIEQRRRDEGHLGGLNFYRP